MKIFITGGTGFIGRHLTDTLLAQGHQLTILSRTGHESSRSGLAYIEGDPKESGAWQEIVCEHDAVINLAGLSILRLWTKKNKQMITDSRLETTGRIVESLSRPTSKVSILVNGSAVGYYGNRGDEEVDEGSGPGTGFLADVARKWEQEAQRGAASGVRVCCCRFGVVLGSDGGALEKMLPAFKLGLGSPLGSGDQWFPWIHINDLTNIITHVLQSAELAGPVNCVAPVPTTNRNFTRELARALHRPAFLPAVPSFLLKIAGGEASTMLLDSQKVVPSVLQKHGFTFIHPDIASALQQIVA